MRTIGLHSILIFLFLIGSVFAKQDFFSQANTLYDQGKYMEAIKYYRAAIQEGQYEPFAWFNLGNSLIQIGKHNIAMVAYKRSTELAPKFVRPWMLLGDLYFTHDDYGLAIAAYRRASELGENSEHLHYAKAECYRKLGEWTLAQKEYEQVLKLNQDRIDCWLALAEIQEKLEDYPEAVRVLRKAIELTPTAGAEAFFYLAYLQLEQDSTTKGIQALEDGLLLNPGNLLARRHLASLYQNQGSPWMSVFTLEQGLDTKNTKDRSDLHVDLGQVYFDQERFDESLNHFVEAWKLGNVQGRIGAENVGNSFFNSGDTLKAEYAYRRIRLKQ